MNKHNFLHGVTLERIVTELVEEFGWTSLGMIINIRCFTYDPSIKSSLKFLRRTPWARQKVEDLYIEMRYRQEREEKKDISTKKDPE